MKKFLALLIFIPSIAAAQAISDQARAEVSYLLNYLRSSGCHFNRNGTWYTAPEAADHLNQKYAHLLKKGLVGSAEDFISRAATESSISGKAYHVKCAAAAEAESGPWLGAVLAEYRAKH